VGLVLLVLWVGALQLMVDQGKEQDWFESTEIVVLALTAAVGFAYFLVWELTARQPLVNLRFFARRNFTVGVLSLSVAYGLFFGNVVLLPLWLQQWMGYTATWAGLATAPVGLLAIALSPWVGRNVNRIDPRKLATLSFLGFAYVLWLRSNFSTQVPFEVVLIPTVLQGAAMAFFFIPLQTVVFSGLPPEQMPAAAGVSNFARITAGAVGTSIFTTLWERRAALHHGHLVEALQAGRGGAQPALDTLGSLGLGAEQALATVERQLQQQAFTMAVTDLFLLSSVIYLLLVPLLWWARPVQRVAAPPAVADAAG
jgi:DHA2 family multidrug resistance protein